MPLPDLTAGEAQTLVKFEILERVVRRFCLLSTCRLDFQAPGNFVLASGVAQTIFRNTVDPVNPGVTIGLNQALATIEIQNNGAFPVKWAVNSVVSANSYNGILAACSAVEDGLGSIRRFVGLKGYVSVMSVGGAGSVSTFIGYENI